MDTRMEPIVPNINRILVIFGLANGDNSLGHGMWRIWVYKAFWLINQPRFPTSYNSAPVNSAWHGSMLLSPFYHWSLTWKQN